MFRFVIAMKFFRQVGSFWPSLKILFRCIFVSQKTKNPTDLFFLRQWVICLDKGYLISKCWLRSCDKSPWNIKETLLHLIYAYMAASINNALHNTILAADKIVCNLFLQLMRSIFILYVFASVLYLAPVDQRGFIIWIFIHVTYVIRLHNSAKITF